MAEFQDNCPFCNIAKSYPPGSNPVPDNPNPEAVMPNCFLLLSTDLALAFLDIMPITEGHVLVVSRTHREKLGHLQGSEGAALGSWLPVVSRAVMRALGRDEGDWNVVQNNGASAAQVVPHVHYHIIPRAPVVPEMKIKSWTMFGRGQREELDDEEAAKLAAKIRREINKDLDSMSRHDSDGRNVLGKL